MKKIISRVINLAHRLMDKNRFNNFHFYSGPDTHKRARKKVHSIFPQQIFPIVCDDDDGDDDDTFPFLLAVGAACEKLLLPSIPLAAFITEVLSLLIFYSWINKDSIWQFQCLIMNRIFFNIRFRCLLNLSLALFHCLDPIFGCLLFSLYSKTNNCTKESH